MVYQRDPAASPESKRVRMWGCWSRAGQMDHRAGTARGLSWPRGPGAGLEGDQAIVPEIARQIDGGHPAPAQLALEEVAVAESVPELDGDVGHGDGLKWRPSKSARKRFDLLARVGLGRPRPYNDRSYSCWVKPSAAGHSLDERTSACFRSFSGLISLSGQLPSPTTGRGHAS
jgi:hypothetical protein